MANPAWPEYFADPFVLKDAAGYYAYGTAGADEDAAARGTHFRVLRSPDLVRWTAIGHALVEPAALRGCAFWAPEVAHHRDVFYLYYSAGGPEGEEHRLRVASARSPAGPFVDAGVHVVAGERFSIDAHPFHDPRSGAWFLFFVKDYFDEPVGSGIAVAPLAADMLRTDGPVRTAFRAVAPWHVFARNRRWYGRTWATWHTVEGPCVVYREARYWLFYSGGLWKGADYGVGVAVADAVLGPYREEARPAPSVLRAGDDRRGPGHNSIVQAPDGGDRIVYHAWDACFAARRMFIDRLLWTPAGPRVATTV